MLLDYPLVTMSPPTSSTNACLELSNRRALSQRPWPISDIPSQPHVFLSLNSSSRAPRRSFDGKGSQTTVTRKSAPARIAALPRLPQGTLQIPPEITVTTRISEARKRFSLSPSVTPGYAKSSRHVRRHKTIDFKGSKGSGDESDASYNCFVLCLKKKEVLRLDSELSIDDGGLDRTLSGGSTSPNIKDARGSQATIYRVLKSHYPSEPSRNSKLNAQLIVGPNKGPNKGPGQLECPFLDDDERNGAVSILRTSREKSDRSLRRPVSISGTYVEPEYYEETIEASVFQGPRWVAIPCFYLTPAASQNKGHKSEGFSDYAKKGVICEGHFFQVAQFWCLLIGDGTAGLMVSCTRMAVKDLPGSLVNIRHVPPADSATLITGDGAPMLQVSDGGLRLWLLPLDECETWPAFVTHSIKLGFSLVDGWQVKYRGLVLAIARRNSLDHDCFYGTKDYGQARALSKVEEPDEDAYASSDDEQTQMTPPNVPVISRQPLFSSTFEMGLGESFDGLAETSNELNVEDFHVFTLLATVPTSTHSDTSMGNTAASAFKETRLRIDEQQLEQGLTAVDGYLSTPNSRQMECMSYGMVDVQRRRHTMSNNLYPALTNPTARTISPKERSYQPSEPSLIFFFQFDIVILLRSKYAIVSVCISYGLWHSRLSHTEFEKASAYNS
ncbi:hypothetical protein P154DRAFT_587298 [Amniculicola lignicola CBS 123094]|uniref:Uncharacterized protein n=1 Tax=Amniculicola lignicola CBS 123094 TaxID=1392246 RepID=A0A6A5WUC2_9PLEO|nr:hypothetical protein P154DRAFT_587298 [Amniculicola lignicola CBS 123094]